MRAGKVVVLEPRQQVKVAFLGVGPVANIGPFPKSGLDETFGLAVGAGRVGARETVADAELAASLTELARAIAASVVGEQAPDTDVVLRIKSKGALQEGDGGFCLLIGHELREG